MLKFRLVCVFLVTCVSCFAHVTVCSNRLIYRILNYFREMYLPQLTAGPSAAAWSPDSRSLVYSMAGLLWRQETGSTKAEQLTAGPGYDYQPDWSSNSDGRWVVFARYDHGAIELWSLDGRDGRTQSCPSQRPTQNHL